MKSTSFRSFSIAWVVAVSTFASTVFAQELEGDPVNGERVFLKCKSCHTFDKAKIGPPLNDVMGRQAGTIEGFRYSKSMVEYGQVWEFENLDAYLERPRAVVPAGRMAFAGLRKPQDRADVIAYIIANQSNVVTEGAATEEEPAEATDASATVDVETETDATGDETSDATDTDGAAGEEPGEEVVDAGDQASGESMPTDAAE